MEIKDNTDDKEAYDKIVITIFFILLIVMFSIFILLDIAAFTGNLYIVYSHNNCVNDYYIN